MFAEPSKTVRAAMWWLRLPPWGVSVFIFKSRYSAFDHTPLEPMLRDEDIGGIYLAGAALEGCVVQTAIDARELGFQVTIVTGACATVDEELEEVALAYATQWAAPSQFPISVAIVYRPARARRTAVGDDHDPRSGRAEARPRPRGPAS